jgi:hypothetical protein
MPFQKGHKKIGGKPKGFKAPATIDKELYRERLRQLVCAQLEPMAEAQVEHAKGVQYMILRMPDGTYARATEEKQIDAACAIGATAFKIMTQAPNTQAFTALLDRALDKPKDQPLEVNLKATVNVVDTLRQRMANRKKAE